LITKITYKFDRKLEFIKIFGEAFVENNKDLKFVYENKIYNLSSSLFASKIKNNAIEICLSGFNSNINLSYMFSGCNEANYISFNNFLRYYNVTSISYMFYDCRSLKSLPDDISNLDLSTVTNITSIFAFCYSLETLPDISKWNISNVKNISGIFLECLSLSYLPDISKWNTSNVIDMSNIFYNCKSLQYLPDISKWNTSNVIDISNIFYNCKSLEYLPDISK